MIVGFDEVYDIFASYTIWSGGKELLWYKKAWSALEKDGLTTYEKSIDHTVVLIRAFTLIVLYQEFCDLAFGESFFYELTDWQDYSGLNAFRIGQLILQKGNDFSEYDDYEDDEALEAAFLELIENERHRVFDSLCKIDIGRESTLFVAMYLTAIDMSEEDYDDIDIEDEDDEIEIIDLDENEVDEFQKYEADIEKYYEEIVNDLSDSKMEAFCWLSEGTYRIRLT